MTPTALTLLGIAVAALIPITSFAKQEPAPPFEPTLPWLSDFDEAIAAAKKSGSPILVEFR